MNFDLVLCVVLWIEFIYSNLKSDEKPSLKDNAISIIGMLPFDFIFLRALRIIKLFQLLKTLLVTILNEKSITKFLRETLLDEIILIAIIFIFVTTILIQFLDPTIHDIPTAFWYIIVSMTSTGYGDIIPTTSSGHIIGIVTMVGGILIFASVTAVISSQYVSKINQNQYAEFELKIENLTSEIEELNKKMDEIKKDNKKP